MMKCIKVYFKNIVSSNIYFYKKYIESFTGEVSFDKIGWIRLSASMAIWSTASNYFLARQRL